MHQILLGKKEKIIDFVFYCDVMFIYSPHTHTTVEFSELKFWSDTLSDQGKEYLKI